MMDPLRERIRRIRERELIRAWEYRQRDGSHGVWFRLRRALTDAEQAWIIDEREADRLEAAGFSPLPVGFELSPAKRIFMIPAAKAGGITKTREVPVRLSQDILQAGSIVLIPFAGL